MWVSFPMIKKNSARPEIGEGPALFRTTAVVMCFSSGYSSRVAPQRCSFRFTGRSIYVLFRFLVQRYNNYLIYASVLAKKLQKYVVKHKKEGAKAPSPMRNRTLKRLSIKVRQNVS